MIKTPSSALSNRRARGLTNFHKAAESNSSEARRRVILSWLTSPPLIRERPVAVAWVNELR